MITRAPPPAARTKRIREWARGMVPSRRRFWWAGGVVVIALLFWASRLARSRKLFSVVWGKWNALQESPTLPWSLPLGLAAVVVLVLILWKVPQWQVGRVKRLSSKERFDRVNEARKTLATILGGVLLLAGFFGTWQNIKVAQEAASTSQKALQVSQEGQITDRFTKAIEQLGATDANGKPKLEVRLGGIYALERIANDSERDHWPIMEVLCTYVRENAPRNQESPAGEEQKAKKTTKENQASASPSHPRADIQAILTVLGRRSRKYETEDEHLDLHETDLRGADLQGDFSGAKLFRADLREADLHLAYFSWANLSRADLREAELFWADLSWADLSGADLTRADLSGAYLHGAYLSGTRDLTQQQLDAARGNAWTQLPAGLHMPDSWRK
ncbi:MAG: pentapeptide repeat-containing protein [Candidatus Korobacteraceae bacterium]|jgi:pentapeptide repeat protein